MKRDTGEFLTCKGKQGVCKALEALETLERAYI